MLLSYDNLSQGLLSRLLGPLLPSLGTGVGGPTRKHEQVARPSSGSRSSCRVPLVGPLMTDRSFDAYRRGSSRGVACVHALSSRKRILGTTRILRWKPFVLQLCTKHDLKGAGLIKNTLQRLHWSFSDLDNDYECRIDKTPTLGSISSFLAKIKSIENIIKPGIYGWTLIWLKIHVFWSSIITLLKTMQNFLQKTACELVQ